MLVALSICRARRWRRINLREIGEEVAGVTTVALVLRERARRRAGFRARPDPLWEGGLLHVGGVGTRARACARKKIPRARERGR